MTSLDLFTLDNEPSLQPVQPENSGAVAFLDFHGETIPVLIDDRGRWASVTRLCQSMGIDANGQRQAIERKRWSKGMTCVMHVMLPGQPRAYPNFFIHEKRLPMWLANIETDRLADPEVRANVEATQIEFADVLAEWVATGEVRPDLSDPLLELQRASENLSRSVALALAERRRAEVAEAGVKALLPAANAWETFRATGATLSVSAAAKYLVQRHGVNTGRNKLYGTLRSLGWVFKRTCEPTGEAVKAGLVEIEAGSKFTVEKTGEQRNGSPRTRLTADGLIKLAEHFGVVLDTDALAGFIAEEHQRSAA